MVRAHSLLYAVYVCLIISVICAGLLYYSGLYGQLNSYYNRHEELFLHNQSMVNYALLNDSDSSEHLDEQGIATIYERKRHGVLKVVSVSSFVANDTVTSVHFVGDRRIDDTCLSLPDFSSPLSFSGTVTMVGTVTVPGGEITPSYMGVPNQLIRQGRDNPATQMLPALDSEIADAPAMNSIRHIGFSKNHMAGDSIYFNSFANEVVIIDLESPVLRGKIIKGNFIIRSRDSIVVYSDAVLEDVILSAPKIVIQENFSGSVQVFATDAIKVGANVILNYPSILSLKNKTDHNSAIDIKENVTIFGAIVLHGFSVKWIDNNRIHFSKGSLLYGDIYCQGVLELAGTVYGSVYTNRLATKTASDLLQNRIYNVEINVNMLPDYFVRIPLFAIKDKAYAVFKKVL